MKILFSGYKGEEIAELNDKGCRTQGQLEAFKKLCVDNNILYAVGENPFLVEFPNESYTCHFCAMLCDIHGNTKIYRISAKGKKISGGISIGIHEIPQEEIDRIKALTAD